MAAVELVVRLRQIGFAKVAENEAAAFVSGGLSGQLYAATEQAVHGRLTDVLDERVLAAANVPTVQSRSASLPLMISPRAHPHTTKAQSQKTHNMTITRPHDSQAKGDGKVRGQVAVRHTCGRGGDVGVDSSFTSQAAQWGTPFV